MASSVLLVRPIVVPPHIFCQYDFVAQKSHLEEYVTSRGYICDFYLKFHCELKFIKQYWGAVKFLYWSSPKTADMDAMECNMNACLDNVPLLQIRRYVQAATIYTNYYFVC